MGEEPTAAWILSLIGGILGVIGYGWMTAAVFAFGGAATGIPGIGGAAAAATAVYGAICLWFLIAHIIIIIGAFKIKSGEPSSVRSGGMLVLIFSILGGINILALIGGILALTWKPSKPVTTAAAAPPPPPPT